MTLVIRIPPLSIPLYLTDESDVQHHTQTYTHTLTHQHSKTDTNTHTHRQIAHADTYTDTHTDTNTHTHPSLAPMSLNSTPVHVCEFVCVHDTCTRV
jgi:hypothetical protein